MSKVFILANDESTIYNFRLELVKQLINEGNVRRIIIKNEKGESFMEFPVTLGVVGAVLLPVFAALGAAVALMTKCTIVVERRD